MKEGVLYNITCDEYKSKEKKAEYWGETGRDGYARGGEHLKGCRDKDKENALWKHIEGEHGGEKGDEIFTMRIDRGFKKALARQICEGVAIETCEGQVLKQSGTTQAYRG